jgi:tetratricopeptide (TPR) repeat protein
MSREWPEWLQVGAVIGGQVAKGWIKKTDLVLSDGWQRFMGRDYPAATSLLRAEAALAPDPSLRAWLTLQLGFACHASGQLDQAVETLETLARERPVYALTPFAYLAAARVHLDRHDADAMLRTYEALLNAVPSYRVPSVECEARAPAGRQLCSGEASIERRVVALRALVARQALTTRVLNNPAATGVEKASAWYALGAEWEKKNEIDPGFQETRVPNDDPRRCYEAAVVAAPGSVVSGEAAWKLIAFSAPYEWEGDIEARTEWTLKHYGAFLQTYPGHARSGEALYQIATATWASGGYPEAYDYMFAPAGWSTLGPKRQQLEQWFDTRGFGGGVGPLTNPKPEEAKEVVTKHPTSRAAPMAQYYAAVILDYCLSDRTRALFEFEAFLGKYPQIEPFATKARARVAVLRRMP